MKQFFQSLSWFERFVFGCIALLCFPCVVWGLVIMFQAESNPERIVGFLACMTGLFFAGCFAIALAFNAFFDALDALAPRKEP